MGRNHLSVVNVVKDSQSKSFIRSILPNMLETSLTNVKCAPSNSITKRICGGTCACILAKNRSPAKSVVRVSFEKIEWSNILILTRKSNLYS